MKDNKTARLELRVQPAEKEKIQRSAKRSGLSVTGYILRCCTQKEPRLKPPDAFWALLEQLYDLVDYLPPEKQEELLGLMLQLQEAASWQ